MIFNALILLFYLLWAIPTLASPSDEPSPIDFRVDNYSRDSKTNTITGKGNAYIKTQSTEIWGNELRIDFNTNVAQLTGDVHIIDQGAHIWASFAEYHLDGTQATFENATMVSDQVILTGKILKKLSPEEFEIDDGSYTNCNLSETIAKHATVCDVDWKLAGRKFSIKREGYAHVLDGVLFIRSVPTLYLPYFVVPIKSKRQSGLLIPQWLTRNNLGAGFRWPLFMALGPWHDLLLTPTLWTRPDLNQLHVLSQYEYIYSADKRGTLKFGITSRRFSTIPSDPAALAERHRALGGILGEWALNAKNRYRFSENTYAHLVLRRISHPFYRVDYADDLDGQQELGFMRSQILINTHSEKLLLSGALETHQLMHITKDSGADLGPVDRLPDVVSAFSTQNIWNRFLSFEVDSRFTHFSRKGAFDQIPATRLGESVEHTDNPAFDENDFLRTGQRLQVEPRLIATLPMPDGLQFQPVLRAGTLLYHFNVPESAVIDRYYSDIELPLTLYFSRQYHLEASGYSRVSHVFQPRLVYSKSLYRNEDLVDNPISNRHPFFRAGSTFFDYQDLLTPLENIRLELINRLRRKRGSLVERFFLLQVSNQYNIKKDPNDPPRDVRFQEYLGPVEILSEIQIQPFSLSAQALVPLKLKNEVRETEYSLVLGYDHGGDSVSLSSLFRQRADRNNTQQISSLAFRKALPIVFDIDGAMTYSFKEGRLLGYNLGLTFSEKPKSCWTLSISGGRDAYFQTFASIRFNFSFGSPGGIQL